MNIFNLIVSRSQPPLKTPSGDYFKLQVEQSVRSLNALSDIEALLNEVNLSLIERRELVAIMCKVNNIATRAIEKIHEKKSQSSAQVLAPQG